MTESPNKSEKSSARRKYAHAWILAHRDHAGSECLTWPFARDDKGYGTFGHLGKHYKAHRYMCRLVNGEPPTPKHVASHSCGRGHLGCVHPKHLEWKTQPQNQFDRAIHGTKNKGHMGIGQKGRITKEQEAQIQALAGRLSIVKIAEKFGIKRGTVDYYHRKARTRAA